MDRSTDALGALGWGVKKYAWLVATFALAVGVILPIMLNRAADVYEARAQVGPLGELSLPNLDPLPRIGESVFNNGSVASAVRDDQQLADTDRVIPSRVDLVASLDNIVFIVIGRDADAELAQRIAEIAASTFVDEMNKYAESVGVFEIQQPASLPAEPLPRSGGPVVIGLGVLAGLAAGLGAVVLLLLWRRPVVASAAASDATGVPVLAKLRLGRSGGGAREVVGIAPLCRRLLASQSDLILVASNAKAVHERHEVATAMGAIMATAREVAVLPWGERLPHVRALPVHETETAVGEDVATAWVSDRPRRSRRAIGPESADRPRLVIVDGPTPEEIATRSDTSMMVLIVQRGISLSSLQASADQYLDGGPSGLVLVERAKWYMRNR